MVQESRGHYVYAFEHTCGHKLRCTSTSGPGFGSQPEVLARYGQQLHGIQVNNANLSLLKALLDFEAVNNSKAAGQSGRLGQSNCSGRCEELGSNGTTSAQFWLRAPNSINKKRPKAVLSEQCRDSRHHAADQVFKPHLYSSSSSCQRQQRSCFAADSLLRATSTRLQWPWDGQHECMHVQLHRWIRERLHCK